MALDKAVRVTPETPSISLILLDKELNRALRIQSVISLFRGCTFMRFTTVALVPIFVLLGSAIAFAGFDSWSSDIDENPFTKGFSVNVSNFASIRSGVLIMCDSAKSGLTVRAVPGFTYTDVLALIKPRMKFAFDGEVLFSETGETGAVGDNLAIAQTHLEGLNARRFVDAFMGARRQIAIEDGISDSPHLMNARGSTKAGKVLDTCLNLQKDDKP